MRSNSERAGHAGAALRTYSNMTHAQGTEAVTDLIADLMHLHNEATVARCFAMARNHYQAETSDLTGPLFDGLGESL